MDLVQSAWDVGKISLDILSTQRLAGMQSSLIRSVACIVRPWSRGDGKGKLFADGFNGFSAGGLSQGERGGGDEV